MTESALRAEKGRSSYRSGRDGGNETAEGTPRLPCPAPHGLRGRRQQKRAAPLRGDGARSLTSQRLAGGPTCVWLPNSRTVPGRGLRATATAAAAFGGIHFAVPRKEGRTCRALRDRMMITWRGTCKGRLRAHYRAGRKGRSPRRLQRSRPRVDPGSFRGAAPRGPALR
jgi:hypothetical protein